MKREGYRRLFFLCVLFASHSISAQSVLIDPQGDGGFELSGGFIGNGWTVVNSTVNQWNLSGVPGPYEGASAAFISPNLGNDYVYDVLSSSTSHIYKEITVPAGENYINLNFWYKNPGEPLFDRLLVYTAPVNIDPQIDSPSNGLTDIPGATLIYTDNANVYSYTNVSLTLPQALAGTSFRLIFTWQNDAADGTAIPVALDNVSLTSQSSLFGGPLNGYYTIDNTAPTSPFLPDPGSNFANFQDAINYLNNYGISGDVRFDVQAGQTFNHSPLIMNVGGTATDTIGFVRSGSGANPLISSSGGTGATGGDAAIALNGVDYISFDGIDLFTQQNPSTSVLNIECGFKIFNASATNGAQFNRIRNCSVYMNKLNTFTSNTGIIQLTAVIPTANSGANSFNEFSNVTIDNTVFGVRVSSNGNFRDDQVKILNCKIGEGAPNSIGGINGQVYGIYVVNAQNIEVSGNTVRNVATNGAVDGIFLTGVSGTSTINGNRIRSVRNTLSTSIGIATGIRCVVASSSTVNIYNNFVSDINVTYNTASASNPAPIFVKGISIQPTGAVTASNINADFNNVSINTSLNPNISSTCFEVIQTGPVVNVRNNIFSNSTSDQFGNPFHYAMVIPNFSIAAAGGVSNYNDLFLSNSSNGVLVRKTATTATNYTTLTAWNTASSQDANSVSADPVFVDPNTDLHVFASELDQTGSFTGITWVALDIDGEIRPAVPDIGADEFSMIAYDISAEAIVAPDSIGCFTSSEQITAKIRNLAYQAIDFSVDPLQLTVNVTGAASGSYPLTISDNSLNGGVPLASMAFLEIPVGLIDMTTYGTYTFDATVSLGLDMVPSNDQLAQSYTVTNVAPVSLPQSVPFDGFNSTNLEQIYPGWKESESGYPLNGISAWIAATGLDDATNVTAVFNMNSGNAESWIIGPKIIPAFNTFLSFDLALTDPFAISGGGQFDPDDSLQVLVSVDCGLTYQPIAHFGFDSLIGNSLQNYQLFLGNLDGQEVITAFRATDGSTNGAPFALHLDNINIDNSTQKSISIISLTEPVGSPCFSASESFSVLIGNNGFSDLDFTQTPVLLSAYLNGTLIGTETLSIGSLLIGEQIPVPFTATVDLTAVGQYSLSVSAVMSTSGGSVSDSIQQYLYSQNPSVNITGSDSLCFGQEAVFTATPQVNGITDQLLPRFEYSGPVVTIPDNDPTGIDIPLLISGSGGFAAQLVEVRIDELLHANLTHLSFSLKAPDGSSVLLTQFNQGNGPGYFMTVFTESAAGNIAQGTAPFTGSFLPSEAFGQLTGEANGTWYLNVSDQATGTIGQLNAWSLVFHEGNTLSSYNWQTANSIVQEDFSSLSIVASTDEIISYTLTDAVGCSAGSNLEIFVSNLALNSSQVTDVSCFGLNDGSILTSVTGGLGQVSYNWNTFPVQNSSNAMGLSGGSYTLNVLDDAGCSGSFNFTVSEPDELLVFGITDTIFCSGCSANVAIFATGGTPPYAGTGMLEVFTAGSNTFSVTDANGCTAEIELFVEDVSSVEEQSADAFRIYPVPFDKTLNIESPLEEWNYVLTDINGKVVINGYSPGKQLKLNMDSIAPGVYLFHIQDLSGRGITTGRLIKY